MTKAQKAALQKAYDDYGPLGPLFLWGTLFPKAKK